MAEKPLLPPQGHGVHRIAHPAAVQVPEEDLGSEQGIAAVDDRDVILISGYMKDDSASRIYVTNSKNESRYVILKKKGKVDFFELFEVVTKEYIVVTFLAILEMARKSELRIYQENDFEQIMVEVVS